MKTPLKAFKVLMANFQHVFQNIFLIADNGDNFITEDGANTFVTENSDL